MIVNLDAVNFLDSTGLGVLVGGLKLIRAQEGSLGVVCSRAWTLRILRIGGVDQALEVYDFA